MTMRRHRRRVVIYTPRRPQKKSTLMTTCSLTSSFQICEKANVCGNTLWTVFAVRAQRNQHNRFGHSGFPCALAKLHRVALSSSVLAFSCWVLPASSSWSFFINGPQTPTTLFFSWDLWFFCFCPSPWFLCPTLPFVSVLFRPAYLILICGFLLF